jgi:hypothetical protein
MHTSGFSLATEASEGPADEKKRYCTQMPTRYEDLQRSDEGDTRFAYEHGRARLFAKGRLDQHVPREHPTSASQENYAETPPAPRGGGGAARGSPLQLPASCATCRGCLSCGEREGDVFCAGCNTEALRLPSQ